MTLVSVPNRVRWLLLSHGLLCGRLRQLTCRLQESAEASPVLPNSLNKNSTYPSDAFGGLPKRKSIPIDLVGTQPIQISDSLLTTGTVDWPHVLLSEHGFVFLRLASSISLQVLYHLVELFDLTCLKSKASTYSFFESSQLLTGSVLVREHVLHVAHQLIKLVHQVLLQRCQIIVSCLSVQISANSL